MPPAPLHVIKRSPHSSSDLERVLEVAREGAHIILVQDAVLAAADTSANRAWLGDAVSNGITVHALDEDLRARGVERVLEGMDVVDYGGWVDLVDEHLPVTW